MSSASWMNQIETWFGILTRQAIRRGAFRSVKELVERIETFTAAWNAGTSPFAWVKSADEILAKAVRKPPGAAPHARSCLRPGSTAGWRGAGLALRGPCPASGGRPTLGDPDAVAGRIAEGRVEAAGPVGRRFGDFSKRSVLRAAVGAEDTRRDEREVGRRRVRRPVGEPRHAGDPPEACRERADAREADRHADLGDRAIGGPAQGCRPLEPARQQVDVGRLAKGPAELGAEVRPGQARLAGHVADVEGFIELRVGKVSRTEQVASRRNRGHVRPWRAGTRASAGVSRPFGPGRRDRDRFGGERRAR